MKKLITGLLLSASFAAPAAMAATVEVEITNLTNSIYFTPLLVATHKQHTGLFEVGTPATEGLQAMAEGGDISGLADDQMSMGSYVEANPAGGLLAPGASTTATIQYSYRNRWLSLVGMLLPTNDGFVGLDSIKLTRTPGTYTFYLNGYDAGTEANDELLVMGSGAPGMPGIPADPGGNSGTGGTGVTMSENNTMVHIHRGTVGDDDLAGGTSDLDSGVHRWLNPVAKVVVTVKPRWGK